MWAGHPTVPALLVLLAVCLLVDVMMADGDTSSADKDDWARMDKAQHCAACCALAFAGLAALSRLHLLVGCSACKPTRDMQERAVAAVVLGVGVAKELYDGPRASLRDFVADVFGLALGIAGVGLGASPQAQTSSPLPPLV